MQKRHIDKVLERRILIGMIVSDKYLQQVQSIYNADFLDSKILKDIAKWCIEYYTQYEKAPGLHIQDVLNHKIREEDLDDSQINFIETLLASLSEEYERRDKFNVDYLLDQTEKLFKERSLKNVAEDINTHLANKDLLQAEALFSQYRLVELPKTKGICPLSDEKAIEQALDRVKEEQLFTLPGRLGEVMNPQFVRDSFIGIMGSEKKGKSWWLMEFAFRAYRSRCNVVLFDTGDMTETQKLRRIHSYLSQRPVINVFSDIYVPILDCVRNQDNSCSELMRENKIKLYEFKQDDDYKSIFERMVGNEYISCSKCSKYKGGKFKGAVWYEKRTVEPLTWQEAAVQGQKWMRRTKGKRFKLSCHSSGSLNVRGLINLLDIWERFENFIPDVIVVDYADIMAPEDAGKESRHQENDRWSALRALSQNRHCCVITATQANAASYDKESIGMKNFSEDKRKFGHVTAMYGLNQTPEEKYKGIMRIGELVVREGEFDTRRKVHVLQCLQIGRPFLASY